MGEVASKGIVFHSEARAIGYAGWCLLQKVITRYTFALDEHKGPHHLPATLALSKFLYPEEQVADLVDYFGVSTRLTTRKTLIGGENKI